MLFEIKKDCFCFFIHVNDKYRNQEHNNFLINALYRKKKLIISFFF